MDYKTKNQIENLKNKSLDELIEKYQKLFNNQLPHSNNKVYLKRRIAYRLQEIQHESLSDKSRNKIKELIRIYDPLNNKDLTINKLFYKRLSGKDERVPIAGTIITRKYKGKTLEVKVLEDGFEYMGKKYKTLTSVVKDITGSHWSGFDFFNL